MTTIIRQKSYNSFSRFSHFNTFAHVIRTCLQYIKLICYKETVQCYVKCSVYIIMIDKLLDAL